MSRQSRKYEVEVSYGFNGPRSWVTVEAESMTYARAAARRGTLVPGKGRKPGYYEGGCYDTHQVREVAA